jgi:RimJ/RimL family protein N-acetyltransferase
MGETEDAPKPFDRVGWPVRTARLLLRPVTADDFPRLYEIRAIPEVTHWLTGRPTSYDDYVARYGTPERLDSTLVVEAGDTIVGDLFLALVTPYAQVEVRDRAVHSEAAVGWLLDPAFTGRGYATEAVAEVVRICFEDLGVRRVVASAFADNTASLRVMERVGLRIEGRTRGGSLHRELGWVDGVDAALLAQEWVAKPR